uniref:Uncharacterized protein n=1 Tax=Ralstonia solanacearum TaxID=305 RepID=A0A0S4U3Z4_RALSL|nr:conserved protein of unknown function [Ralstonia solanacearum]
MHLIRFEAENKPAIDAPTTAQIRRGIQSLKSYGPSSFASLIGDTGSYVQVAGGRVTCMVERYDAETGRHFRAFHDRPSPVYPDGTILSFGAGNIPMKADEWFLAQQVVELFIAFLQDQPFPEYVRWREVLGLHD